MSALPPEANSVPLAPTSCGAGWPKAASVAIHSCGGEGWRDWREASGVFAELRAEEAGRSLPVAETATADVATPVTHVTRPKAPRVRERQGHPCCCDARCCCCGACGRLLLGLV